MVFFVPRVPLVRSFVTVLVFPMIFSCSYLGPFICVGFTFSSCLLFCIILPGAHTFLSFREPLFVRCTCKVLASGAGSSRFLIIHGPGPFLALGASFERRVLLPVRDSFWLREPGLKEECHWRSGTVLTSGASSARGVLLTVWDRFAPGAGFERSAF